MKPLEEMTNEELWVLFPIQLSPHNPAWKGRYRREAAAVRAAAGDSVARISHVGSTSVPGLVAKPIIDIFLEVFDGTDLDGLRRALGGIGYRFAAQPANPPPHMMFMKGYTEQGFADEVFHLHIRYPGDWGEYYFRDYLSDHPETAAEYAWLKEGLKERYEHDRDAYTAAKTDFCLRVTEAARGLYGGRYLPES